MEIKTFTVNPLGVNCYVISHAGEAAIIDCGCFTEKEWMTIKTYFEQEKLQLKYVLQTHGHFDHTYGLQYVKRDFGLSPWLHAQEVETYNNAADMAYQFIGVRLPVELPAIAGTFVHGDKFSLGNESQGTATTLEVLHTPGHTPGGVCFHCAAEGILFSGDTLFQGSLGRADLPGGDMLTEIDSIMKQLFTLPDDTRVLPGHGPETTIGHERKYNPYF